LCFCPAVGLSSGPSRGWAAADVSPKTGSDPSKAPRHGQPSPAAEGSHAESQGSQLIEVLLYWALRPHPLLPPKVERGCSAIITFTFVPFGVSYYSAICHQNSHAATLPIHRGLPNRPVAIMRGAAYVAATASHPSYAQLSVTPTTGNVELGVAKEFPNRDGKARTPPIWVCRKSRQTRITRRIGCLEGVSKSPADNAGRPRSHPSKRGA
jgi:hypothetical protein